MNWDFMNFDMKLKTTTHLFTIKEELTRRHGLIKNLVICKVRPPPQYQPRQQPQGQTALGRHTPGHHFATSLY